MKMETTASMSFAALPRLWSLDADNLALARSEALERIYSWVGDYLCSPHPELGRNGPVCPFVPSALQKKLLFATVYDQDILDIDGVKSILLNEMERFIALEPVSGNEAQFKSLMVLFPALPPGLAADLVDIAQGQLQPHFVPNGLMVGEFHARPPEKRGLWNSAFRPLYSPIPMLAIRHMVPTDILFLKDSPQLFCEYLKIYGNAVPERFREQFHAAATRFGISLEPGESNRQAAPKLVDALDTAGVAYRVHCHDDFAQPIRAPKDFAQALGYSLARITKTLFVREQEREQYYLLVCGMDKRIDLRALAARLGGKRLELASLEALQQHVAYPPTSVSPIGVSGIPVFMDETLMRHDSLLTGSGVPRVEVELSPEALRMICQAEWLSMA